MGQKGGQEIVGGLRPVCFVIATGGCGREPRFVTEPLMAEPVQLGWTDAQTLCGRERVELAGVEGVQNFLNVESGNTMDELFFSWRVRIECCPQARKVFRIELSLSRIQPGNKTAPVKLRGRS